MNRTAQAAFTLIEALIVLTVASILAAAAVPGIQNALRHFRADTAQQTVMMQLRLGRSLAVDQRRIHRVTLSPDGTVALARLENTQVVQLSEIGLPRGIRFEIGDTVPATGSSAPDGISAEGAIHFNGGNLILFHPDGSALDAEGRFCSGVVHMVSPGKPSTARAVSLFGPTGRIRGWRFVPDASEGGRWK